MLFFQRRFLVLDILEYSFYNYNAGFVIEKAAIKGVGEEVKKIFGVKFGVTKRIFLQYC